MDALYLKNTVEAALLAAGRPLDIAAVRELFDEFERPEVDEVREAFAALAADYEGRAVEIVEVASGFRVQVRSSFAGPVSRLWQERPTKYSRALLETLALIAYRQPITRGEIEQIRGVTTNSNIIRALEERDWIRVVGHRDVPGKPELLATTRGFLDYFGLKRLDELPPLSELKDFSELEPQLPIAGMALPTEAGSENDSDNPPETNDNPGAEMVSDPVSNDDNQRDDATAASSEQSDHEHE